MDTTRKWLWPSWSTKEASDRFEANVNSNSIGQTKSCRHNSFVVLIHIDLFVLSQLNRSSRELIS